MKSLKILAVSFGVNYVIHTNSKIEKCKRVYYSLRDAEMAVPGCACDVESYFRRDMCQSYSIDWNSVSQKCLQQLKTT